MENARALRRLNRVFRASLAILNASICITAGAQTQTNSWKSPTSGNWEDMSWSLGELPGTNQTVLVANHGWKAVAIGNNTALNFPQTMSIASLNITSPGTDTVNTVLLNYSGLQTPLTASNIYVGTNAALVVLQSGINSLLAIDGTVIQAEMSQVTGGLNTSSTGAYYLTNGTLNGGFEYISGRFRQEGGSNYCLYLGVYGGEYDLLGGDFVQNLDGTEIHGNFNQTGGTVSSTLAVGRSGVSSGYYELGGGIIRCPYLQVPGTAYNLGDDESSMLQTGGTNITGQLLIGANISDSVSGTEPGFGSYSLTNGVLVTTNISINGRGSFNQSGGIHTNASLTLTQSELFDLEQPGGNSHWYYVLGYYILNGGTFVSDSVNAQPGDFGQFAGWCQITSLQFSGGQYNLNGGQLVVSNIDLSGGAAFVQSGGTLAQSGTLTLHDSGITLGPGPQQLGQLLLSTNENTNATFTLSPGASTLHFANSSGLTWSNAAVLIISNWVGSLSGGGSQQIFFGNNNTGLTSHQLSQIKFHNPAGLLPGVYPAAILATGELVPNAGPIGTPNSWINPASGNWDQPTNWSLGALPDSSQAVLITNSGWKAVSINPSTPVNFPGSMTVSSLTIQGAMSTENTLLLNYFGTAVPLTVLNGLTLRDYAQILDFNSGLDVRGGAFTVTNSQINQDGGFIRTTNAQMNLSDSVYNLTNGVFQAGSVGLGYPTSAQFNQYGGTVSIAGLGFASYIAGPIPDGYSLYGGTLELPGGMLLYGERGGLSYFQSGGTNHTTQITIGADYAGSIPSVTLNGGLLADSGVELMSGDFGDTIFTQNGGTHFITNGLSIIGARVTAEVPAWYQLNGGTLFAGSVNINATGGPSSFNQTNGTANVGDFEGGSSPNESYWGPVLNLSGGTLTCSNMHMADHGAINQTGGALIVSNLLAFDGYIQPGPILYSTYNLTAGTLTASNISVGGIWTIGDSTTNRISNPGMCSLSNKIVIGNAAEQLGHLVLTGNATIDLSGTASRLSFANSSSQAWAGSATLTIADWNGNASGGGAEQLKFGTDASGLTPAQLNQIQVKIGTNTYSAKILSTGEVVPNNAVGPNVAFSMQGNNFVLTWPTGWTLQSATNAPGPYTDIPSAISPYTNDMTLAPRRFFRLHQ
jgi:hypothetical protein